jgi:hypothetical protein
MTDPGVASQQPRSCHSLYERTFFGVTLVLTIVMGVFWFAISFGLWAEAFESSEMEADWPRWWHDVIPCLPVWGSFVAFTTVSVLALRHRRKGLAFFLTLASAVVFYELVVTQIPPWYWK